MTALLNHPGWLALIGGALLCLAVLMFCRGQIALGIPTAALGLVLFALGIAIKLALSI